MVKNTDQEQKRSVAWCTKKGELQASKIGDPRQNTAAVFHKLSPPSTTCAGTGTAFGVAAWPTLLPHLFARLGVKQSGGAGLMGYC